jgi:hypothetical protein
VIATLGLAAHALATRAWRSPAWRAGVRWTAAGALGVAALTWLPLFVRVGVMPVAHDLYLDQVKYVLPARVLPLPPLWPSRPGESWPAFLSGFWEAAVVICFIAPAVAAAIAALRWPARPWLAALVAAAAVATLPQMLGRSDFIHVVYTMAPALALCGAFVELAVSGAWRRVVHVVGAAALLVLMVRPTLEMIPKKRPWNPLIKEGVEYPLPRAAGAYARDRGLVAARMKIRDALARWSPPGAPIYVGLTDHRHTFISEVDLYYLFERPGSTRYLQFDPNMQNRLEVQQAMAAELERAGTRALILSVRFTRVREPNDSSKPGATFLDGYIREKFRLELRAWPYELWVRKE